MRKYAGLIPGLVPLMRAVRARLHARIPHEDIFGDIYKSRLWAVGESVSGIGSDEDQTRAIREQLPSLWQRFGVRTLVDAPCGDFSWMRSIVGQLDSYVGIDVVAPLIEQNRLRYGSFMVTFRTGNILRDAIPKADMVLCRDCFIHFSVSDIAVALANIKRSGAEYLLATTNRLEATNTDILTGSCRAVNLEIAPFSFPEPIDVVDELSDAPGRSLGLWRLSELPIGGRPPRLHDKAR